MNKKGLTLVELLIAISIASILTGIVVLMLTTGFESYSLGQTEVLLEKTLDESLSKIAFGSFDTYGIKDALEIIEAKTDSITFVPLWTDESHLLKPEHGIANIFSKTPFVLNRPHKPGSPVPIAEISSGYGPRRSGRWKEVPIEFVPAKKGDPERLKDKVFLKSPAGSTGRIRFIYHPDTGNFPDTRMTINFEKNRISSDYKGKKVNIPRYSTPGFGLSKLEFFYYDNFNTEIKGRMPNITAVKINMKAFFGTEEKTLRTIEGFTFVNLRNTRTGGKGIGIQEGTRIVIPDSSTIRIFSIANISGFKKDDIIELEARPVQGKPWKVRIELDYEGENKPIIEKYVIEYPSGTIVYSENVRMTTDTSLNFMALGHDSRYDYDFDKNADNVVNLKGKIELVVTRMDASGAQLFIRP